MKPQKVVIHNKDYFAWKYEETVINYCERNSKQYHIKEGTISEQ